MNNNSKVSEDEDSIACAASPKEAEVEYCPDFSAMSYNMADNTDTGSGSGSGAVHNKNKTIVVVGRFGSGKSTLLNTLAGLHWSFTDGHFVSHKDLAGSKVEKFATSRSAKGCTMSAVATDISTFDGRELTVIDTVGYDDAVNAETFYNTSNLTEVMNQYKVISAVVIVVNSRDPRLTQGFLESLLCVPRSFKKKIKQNVILVFTNWSHADEELYAEEPHRGFTEQVNIIRAALGFGADDESITIPTFWVENRPYSKYNDDAKLTIHNLRSFLDCVFTIPELSCHEFKEMRALSQFERVVRKDLKQYFEPSKNRNLADPSGFEKFLFECAYRQGTEIKKFTFTSCTAKAWSDKLVAVLHQDISDLLPLELQRICEEVDMELTSKLGKVTLVNRQMVAGHMTEALIFGTFGTSLGLAPFTWGLSILLLPACHALAYGHSKTWAREDVIHHVVFEISQKCGRDLYASAMDTFTSKLDKLVQEIEECFAGQRTSNIL